MLYLPLLDFKSGYFLEITSSAPHLVQPFHYNDGKIDSDKWESSWKRNWFLDILYIYTHIVEAVTILFKPEHWGR